MLVLLRSDLRQVAHTCLPSGAESQTNQLKPGAAGLSVATLGRSSTCVVLRPTQPFILPWWYGGSINAYWLWQEVMCATGMALGSLAAIIRRTFMVAATHASSGICLNLWCWLLKRPWSEPWFSYAVIRIDRALPFWTLGRGRVEWSVCFPKK